MISLPDSLPLPTQDYSLTVNNSAIRTQMESGRFRQRRRFTSSQNEISVKWEFTDEEYQLFESFVFYALNGGTSWFETKLVSGGGIVTHTARIQDGSIKASYREHFGWAVSATLDIETVNRMDALTIFDLTYETSADDYVDALTNILESYYTENW